MFKKFLLINILILNALFAYCNTEITAAVDKSSVDVTEDITLTVTVDSDATRVDTPQIPAMANFNIYSSGQSRRITMINGKVSSVHVFAFILSPRFAGKFVVEPFILTIDGKEYKTDPIEIEVSRSSPGNAQASLGSRGRGVNSADNNIHVQNNARRPEFFMTAAVDKKSAYINEQVNLRVRFYQAQGTLGNPRYERPSVEGMVFEELKAVQHYENIGGRQYAYTEFPIALFGVVPGKATIGRASVEFNIAAGITDAFDAFFNGVGGSLKKVATNPIAIEIKPLPQAGKPRSFYGAVGSGFQINAALDSSAPRVGEPLTLTVTISGSSNMRSVSDIAAPEMGKNFKVYETTSSYTTKVKGNVLGGTKVYKTVIVPRISGQFTIPAVRFSYFDLSSASYKTVASNPIEINVAPAASGVAPAAVSFGDGNVSSRIEKLTQDINYIKTGAPSTFSIFLDSVADLNEINSIPFIIIVMVALALLYNKSNITFFDGRKAFNKAKKDITKAKSLIEISSALHKYIEAKQGAPIGIMTISDVISKLNLEAKTAQALSSLWRSFDMLKYAPVSDLSDAAVVRDARKRVLKLIDSIEKELK